jgi:hypothetical protein
MKTLPAILGLAACLLLAQTAAPPAAHATDLIIVNQSALTFVCIFDADCSNSVVPRDMVALPAAQPGSDPRLRSLSFPAKAGTPGAGNHAYLYRVDLSQSPASTECVVGLVINFGEPARLPFDVSNVAHVFVIANGGGGTVGVKSAEQDGGVIQFSFAKAVCGGDSSLFFGLASKNPPEASPATLFGYGTPPIMHATAQAPKH